MKHFTSFAASDGARRLTGLRSAQLVFVVVLLVAAMNVTSAAVPPNVMNSVARTLRVIFCPIALLPDRDPRLHCLQSNGTLTTGETDGPSPRRWKWAWRSTQATDGCEEWC
jgi:hypothetical protein